MDGIRFAVWQSNIRWEEVFFPGLMAVMLLFLRPTEMDVSSMFTLVADHLHPIPDRKTETGAADPALGIAIINATSALGVGTGNHDHPSAPSAAKVGKVRAAESINSRAAKSRCCRRRPFPYHPFGVHFAPPDRLCWKSTWQILLQSPDLILVWRARYGVVPR